MGLFSIIFILYLPDLYVLQKWQDFVSDIGGILGLYIGFSLLTIVEFVELFIDLGRLMLMKTLGTFQKKNNSIIDEENVFRVSKVKISSEKDDGLPKYEDTNDLTSISY